MADMSNFFDKVKEGAASAAAATGKAVKGASNSAKKMAETAKLKHEISGLEDKTAGVFREIGELFYTRCNGETAEEAYAELFAKVAETRKEIEAKQQELSQLENSAASPAPLSVPTVVQRSSRGSRRQSMLLMQLKRAIVLHAVWKRLPMLSSARHAAHG